MPVLIAFKKQGGLDILKNLLKTFQDELSKNQTEEEAPLPKLAQIGIKKILDMYSTMVNGKVVVDSVQQVNLLSRHISSADRRAEPQVGPNLLVELRMAILPAVRDIWESNMVEKASAPMLAKTVGILKLISLADSESTAYHRADPVSNCNPTAYHPLANIMKVIVANRRVDSATAVPPSKTIAIRLVFH